MYYFKVSVLAKINCQKRIKKTKPLYLHLKTEGKKKSRAILEFRPYSVFNFGGRNRRPKAENFPFWPKGRNSGIPLKWSAHFANVILTNRILILWIHK